MVRFVDAPDVPEALAGKWIAWNREQTEIVGSGDTMDDAKAAAARAGHREVVLAKVAPRSRWRHYGQHVLCTVAVFISQIPSDFSDLSDLLS